MPVRLTCVAGMEAVTRHSTPMPPFGTPAPAAKLEALLLRWLSIVDARLALVDGYSLLVCAPQSLGELTLTSSIPGINFSNRASDP